MTKTVLVTAIGSFAADAVIRGLKNLSYRVVGCDIYEADWVAQSLMVDAFYQAPPASDEEAYLAFLGSVIEKEQVDFIVPLIDVEVDLMNRNREAIESGNLPRNTADGQAHTHEGAAGMAGAACGDSAQGTADEACGDSAQYTADEACRDSAQCTADKTQRKPAVVCMSPKDVITVLRDKLAINREVKSVLKKLKKGEGKDAVRAVPTKIASRADYEKLVYPIILKPVDGRSSIGLYRIYHEDQLGFAFSCIEDPNMLNDTALDHYLVQPLIKGNVVTVDVVRDSAGHVMCAAREELLRTPNGAGLSVRVFEDEVLTGVCRKLADALGILGCVNFEFIKGEGSGVYYFLECNPRFSGGTAFSVMAGMDAVSAHMAVFEENEIPDGCTLECGNMARKYVECRM